MSVLILASWHQLFQSLFHIKLFLITNTYLHAQNLFRRGFNLPMMCARWQNHLSTPVHGHVANKTSAPLCTYLCVCRQPYQLSKLSLASKDVSSHSCIMEPAVLLSLQWQVMRKLELWYLPVSFRTSSCWATISSNSYNRNVFPRFLQKSTSEWCFRNKNEYILDPSQCPTWRPDIRNHGPNISKTKKTESLHPRLMTCRTKHIHHPQAEPKNLSKSPATW